MPSSELWSLSVWTAPSSGRLLKSTVHSVCWMQLEPNNQDHQRHLTSEPWSLPTSALWKTLWIYEDWNDTLQQQHPSAISLLNSWRFATPLLIRTELQKIPPTLLCSNSSLYYIIFWSKGMTVHTTFYFWLWVVRYEAVWTGSTAPRVADPRMAV